ncbi:hypothetical protein [Streptomyces sp. VRA16 Mangrove soil]|uniref:hypothetical protein n=1 Tax=Streptomyces sp. VRA16 Mangrove soil TaxID=2817434 RepID=UPI001A9CE791|nr:hypothetical protein [Streptomyces sp. VRA16 Mangrove soil]MBO1331164.1 hypothetical protein [Streptomyces sp. VRA16 Mangrove soil]
MTYWFRTAEGSLTSWREVGDAGVVLREAVFDAERPAAMPPEPLAPAPWGAAVVASSRAELSWLAGRFGLLGMALYEDMYGAPTARTAEGGAEVTEGDFERAWGKARSDRHFTPRPTGPLPNGTRLTGTVSVLPWGPGITGLFVDLGPELPLPAFVDMGHLPREPDRWPQVGAVGSYEVTDVRFHSVAQGPCGLQIRLRPAPPAAPAPAPRPSGPGPR